MNKEESKESFEIDVNSLFPKFEEHLKTKNNSRILFSGKFGIGKTYFLNKFFKDKKDKYEVFHLYPINYQISLNENIIEFLKRDILIELLRKESVFFEEDELDKDFISFIKSTWNTNSFLKGAIENTIEILPTQLSNLGRPLKTLLEADKKFQKFKQDTKKFKIEQFLKKNNTETDIISEIIKNKIQKSKEEKLSVLILDDLERIDPEHIFRILNIFSSQFDLNNNKFVNKFGFDKIVLVADYNNLKNIFHHKYGRGTDFDGYFDKFFSKEVFEFNNIEIILNEVDRIISSLKLVDDSGKLFCTDPINSESIALFLRTVLTESLNVEKLNLRRLLKGITFPLNTSEEHFNATAGIKNQASGIDVINYIIKVLITIFDGLEDSFLLTINSIKAKLNNRVDNNENYYKNFAEVLLLEMKNIDKLRSVIIWDSKYTIKCGGGHIEDIRRTSGGAVSTKVLFFELLIKYVKNGNYLKSKKL